MYMRIIKVLTNKDAKHFNKEAPKYEVIIAGFFMVRCPACESFKPAWNDFVKSCKTIDDPNVLIVEVDSNQASNVDFDTSTLEGFPTVYRDIKSKHGVKEFKKERSAKALHHFLKEAIDAKKSQMEDPSSVPSGGRRVKRRNTKKMKKTKRKKRRKSRRKKKTRKRKTRRRRRRRR